MMPQEVGVSVNDGIVRVRASANYYRPSEVDLLIGNPSKAILKLGWDPARTPFAVRSFFV